MKYYIIAGEASGDLHGGDLVRELMKADREAQVRCWGGDLMVAAGAQLVKHYRDLAFMGFTEVLMNLRTIFRNIKFCKEDILANRPDVLILVDYPGFNLRIAKWAHEQGLKVIYYISPQVWAWKENRVKLIRQCVDKMLVILPFEKAFYQKWNYEVEYVGHPLIEVVEAFPAPVQPISPDGKALIALLPGSRKQEVSIKLPIMLEASRAFPDFHFVIAMAPGLEDDFYSSFTAAYPNVITVRNQTYNLLRQARAALVTSGTATLETALFGVPELVCYKGGAISYQIAKRLIKVKYISLVNLIMDKPVVKELIQQELTPANITRELNAILHNEYRRAELKKDYDDLYTLLKKGGYASAAAAKSITNFLNP